MTLYPNIMFSTFQTAVELNAPPDSHHPTREEWMDAVAPDQWTNEQKVQIVDAEHILISGVFDV